MTKDLEFIYDIVSAPSYLAWTQLPAIARETGARVVMTPVLCGAIFKATGNDGPFGVEAKLAWYMDDLMLWAGRLGVPLNLSPHLPIHILPIMRGVGLAEERGETDAYLAAMFEGSFVLGSNLSQPDEVRAALGRAGLDADAYFAGIEGDAVKARLRANTDDAVARGVFGVPTFFVGERLFFGQDRLDFVRDALGDA